MTAREDQVHVRKPSVRAQKALAGVLAGKTQQQALLDAGYSESTARTNSRKILRRVEGELCAELERQGFGVSELARTLIAGCGAEVTVHTERLEMDDVGKAKRVRVTETVPDYKARAQFARLVVDVCGDRAPKKFDVDRGEHVSVEQIRREQARLDQNLDAWLQ